MGSRTRPSGAVNVPTDAEVTQAQEIIADSVRDLSDAASSVVLRLSRITNPVERAKAAMAVRRFSSGDVTNITDGLFRDAVIEAYAAGRAGHGWYGYGALAEELGLSRGRVQQIVNNTWKNKSSKDTASVQTLRESADAARTVRRSAAAGRTPEEIAEETGLTEAAVNDLIG